METNIDLIYLVFGFGQVIMTGIATWTLLSVIKQGNRLTKVETLLETSLIEDIKDLKARVRDVESHCNKCGGL